MYIDITTEWINNYHKGSFLYKNEVDVNGKKFFVGKNGVKQSHDKFEIKTAKLLADKYGFFIEMLPDITGAKEQQNIRMPDLLLNNIPYEMKRIYSCGKNTIKHAIINAKGQANNIILDIQNNVNIDIVREKVIKIFNDNQCLFVNIIVIVFSESIISVYKRK